MVKSQLKGHLNKKHQEYVRRTRQKLVEAVQREISLQEWASVPDQVVYPSPESNPLPHLPIYRDRSRCHQCGHINRSVKRIQQHCWSEHNWRGASRAAPGRPLDM
jgi:hypothetical protein